jgi:short-subunit dehydrogenase
MPAVSPVVVITGASSGIGEALAAEYAAQGYRLALAARSADKLEALAHTLRARHAGLQVLVVQADVTQATDCTRLIAAVEQAYGQLDVLICNAGISMRALFAEVDMEVLRQLMEVNFWGVVQCIQPALPLLRRSKGSIVGVSSIAGYRGLPGRVGYSASKFALNGFLEALRTELQPDGIHVLTACPGYTQSNIRQNALGRKGGEKMREEARMMTAEAVAVAIRRAVDARKQVLVLTPLGRMTVWLNKWLPGRWADAMVLRNFRKEEGL